VRYYKVVVGGKTYTSYAGGKNIPGALNIEMDIPVFAFATPSGAAIVKIWGVSLQEISQASDLNNKPIEVYGGFQKGLPLANPSQAGLLVKGDVFQAFGNWIGTEQSLDLIIYPGTGSTEDPKNIVLNWKKDTKLSDAVRSTLTTAFPDFDVDVKIDEKLVLPADEVGFYGTLTQFAQYVKDVSRSIVNADAYPGVDIALSDKTLTVYDGSVESNPIEIVFRDMIGQPTWIDPLSVQTKFAMRSDLKVGDFIKFPPALVTTGPGTTSPFINAKATFQGVFQISQVRHVGNFRQADAASWVTVVDAYSTKPVEAAA